MSWTPPTDTSGVTGYRIYYIENGESVQSRNMSGAGTKMDMIRDLTTGSAYFIKLEATSNGIPSAMVGPKEITLGMRIH